MIAQVCAAILFFILAAIDILCIPIKAVYALSQKIKDEKTLRSYRRKRGVLIFILAVLVFSMAFVERYQLLQQGQFILLYIILAGVILGLHVLLNLRYLKKM